MKFIPYITYTTTYQWSQLQNSTVKFQCGVKPPHAAIRAFKNVMEWNKGRPNMATIVEQIERLLVRKHYILSLNTPVKMFTCTL